MRLFHLCPLAADLLMRTLSKAVVQKLSIPLPQGSLLGHQRSANPEMAQ